MPNRSREKSRSYGGRPSDEEFVLYLQGIPSHCRWQELKDFIRQSALHIRQAVVYDDPYGYPTGLGQIIVKNENEAWRTFHRLSRHGWDGLPLTVTLARASSPTQPIAGPSHSPSFVTQRSFSRGQSAQMTTPSSPVCSDDFTASPTSVGHLGVDVNSCGPRSNATCTSLPAAPLEHLFPTIAWNGSVNVKCQAPFSASALPQPTFAVPFDVPSTLYSHDIPIFGAPFDIGCAKLPLYGQSTAPDYFYSPQACYEYEYYDLPSPSNNSTTMLTTNKQTPPKMDTRCAHRTISIQNLGKHVTGDTLIEHLSLAGALERFDGPEDGHATAIFRREEDAERAVRLLIDLSNKHYSLGRYLRASVCREEGLSSPNRSSSEFSSNSNKTDDVNGTVNHDTAKKDDDDDNRGGVGGGSSSGRREAKPLLSTSASFPSPFSSPRTPRMTRVWQDPHTVKAFVPSSQPGRSAPIILASETNPRKRRDSGKELLEDLRGGIANTLITSFPLVVNGSGFKKKASI